MITTTFNGKRMIDKEKAHRYIKSKLNTTEYHGENLDALWDVLSTIDTSIKIIFINTDNLIDNLGDYGESIINVFQDAEKENDNIVLKLYN